ncbi:hypothetical protein [Naasia sp. SYSU D00057]|uniref:hypothetical protein n=1 Tax=Naasia sp. SYSU D00057 TaxID=2817380 RepID=UPI001B30F6E2|nr:hypothetical protein [Naasia sp. SYSU D00057]
MDPVCSIVFAVLLGAALLVMLVERRIMRKPESERSERERRYLAGSRRFAMAQNRIVGWVAPILLMVLGVGVLVLAAALGAAAGEAGTALWVLGVVSLLAGVGILIFFRKRRGRDWEQRQIAENQAADQAGRVRWFGAPRAGVALGIGFTLFGALSLWWSLGWLEGAVHPLVAAGLLTIGVVFTVAALSQLRRERADG